MQGFIEQERSPPEAKKKQSNLEWLEKCVKPTLATFIKEPGTSRLKLNAWSLQGVWNKTKNYVVIVLSCLF